MAAYPLDLLCPQSSVGASYWSDATRKKPVGLGSGRRSSKDQPWGHRARQRMIEWPRKGPGPKASIQYAAVRSHEIENLLMTWMNLKV